MLTLRLTETINAVFPTPILSVQIPNHEEHNALLAAAIRQRQAQSAGVTVSNQGGWQSAGELWRWADPGLDWFRTTVRTAVRHIAALPTQETDLSKVDIGFEATAWANINRAGDYNRKHLHPSFDWAVVYFVEFPGTAQGGELELFDPRPLAATAGQTAYGFGRGLNFNPAPGTIVLLPAWVEHIVHPFRGDGERISIATNVRITSPRSDGD